MRFLLGAAEAGFFPGIVLYLTWWFPEADRARTLALFMTAISASYVIGGPLSGGLLELDGLAGLDGWQWLFLCEGLPAVALGFVALRFLDDRPRDAAWLEADERDALSSRVETELQAKGEGGSGSGVRDALRSGQVWLCAAIYFILLSAAFGLTFFVPDLVQERTGLSDFEVGALAAVPYGVATYAMVVLARRADRSGRRRVYVIALLLVGAAGTVFTAYAQTVRASRAGPDARDGRPPGGDPDLLVAADGVPHGRRGGGRHRDDRGDREPRWLRRARLHRRDGGLDR